MHVVLFGEYLRLQFSTVEKEKKNAMQKINFKESIKLSNLIENS